MKDKAIGGPAAIGIVVAVVLVAIIAGVMYMNRPVNNLSSEDQAKAAAMRRAHGG